MIDDFRDPYEGLYFLAQTGTGSSLWADGLGRYWIDSGFGPARVKPVEVNLPPHEPTPVKLYP